MWPIDARSRQVAVVGLPGHGKTVFLAGLFWDSFFALASSLSDPQADGERFVVRAANEVASDLFYDNAILLEQGLLPEANQRVADPPPAVLEYEGIPNRRSWPRRRRLRLHFYDVAGEQFLRDEAVQKSVSYLAAADDLIFVFDPTHPTFSVPAAAALVNRVFRCAPGLARRNVLVVLTKLDRLERLVQSDEDWEAQIARTDADALLQIRHSFGDAQPVSHQMASYRQAMLAVSAHVQSWWQHPDRQGQGVLNLLPRRTRFCVVSALGDVGEYLDERGERRLQGRPEPFRMCDPLLWIFHAAGILA